MDARDPTDDLPLTERTRLRRAPQRGSHLRSDLHGVLDAGFVCHLGLTTDEGPKVFPTVYGREGDRLYLHGSVASRSLRAALDGVPMCVTVTHVDGVVIARSVFEHALNYRSAIIYGIPEVLTDPADKLTGMRAIAEQIAPGQWVRREPTDEELAVTTVLVLPLDEASVKVRTGPPRRRRARRRPAGVGRGAPAAHGTARTAARPRAAGRRAAPPAPRRPGSRGRRPDVDAHRLTLPRRPVVLTVRRGGPPPHGPSPSSCRPGLPAGSRS